MICTKAYITEVPQQNSNMFKVRVPILEDNTGTESSFDALLCSSPNSFNGFSVGDVVVVMFEDDKYNIAFILGKLFTEIPTTSNSYTLTNELKVTNRATLPEDTTIGRFSTSDFINLYQWVSNGGSGGILDPSELSQYVKYDVTKRKNPSTGKTEQIYANKIKLVTGEEYSEIVNSGTVDPNMIYYCSTVPKFEVNATPLEADE